MLRLFILLAVLSLATIGAEGSPTCTLGLVIGALIVGIYKLITSAFVHNSFQSGKAEPNPPPQAISTPTQQPDQAIEPVHFTAYYPEQIQPDTRYTILVYAHIAAAQEILKQDVARFIDQMGNQSPAAMFAKTPSRIRENTALKITLECEDAVFNPPFMSKVWGGEWERFIFEVKVSESLLNELLFVQASIQIEDGAIEIARIKMAIKVVDAVEPAPVRRPRAATHSIDSSLALAKVTQQTSSTYNRIFLSYSRKDSKVVRLCRRAVMALGHDVFMDVESIRAGENWKAAVERAIDEAEIFQLFWSEHSALSSNVQYEWKYALEHKCPESACAEFIRPVYWQQPPPPVPKELGDIHFVYAPLLETD